MNKPKLVVGITQGDSNGIGYEVLIKSLADSRILDSFTPVVYGSSKIFGFYRKQIHEIDQMDTYVIHSAKDVHVKRINIAITLGMGDQGAIAGLEHALQNGPEVDGRGDRRGFHQDDFLPMLQKVMLGEAFLKKGVDHVLRRQIQSQSPVIDGLEFLEARADTFRRIGNILHNVRRAPNFRDTLFLQPAEDGQGVFLRLDTVVQAIQDMAVVIDGTLQQPGVKDGPVSLEKTKHQFLFSSFP